MGDRRNLAERGREARCSDFCLSGHRIAGLSDVSPRTRREKGKDVQSIRGAGFLSFAFDLRGRELQKRRKVVDRFSENVFIEV